MKGRIWVIIIFGLIFILIAGYFAAFSYFDVNGRVSRYLAGQISKTIGADLTGFSVSVMPWAIKIKNVKLQVNNYPLQIEAKSLSARFSLLAFLSNGRPEISAKIYLDHPVFRWFTGKDFSIAKKENSGKNVKLSVKNFPSIQFFMENGSVVFQSGDSTFIFADRMSGWVDGFKKGDAEINFQGRILSQKINMKCKGYINRENDIFRLDINSDKLNISTPGIRILTGDVIPYSGTMSFTVLAFRENGKFGLNGEYLIDDGAFSLKNGNFLMSEIAARGKMNENGISFDSVVGKVWGVQPELQGNVVFSPVPALNIKLKAENVNLADFASEVFPDYKEYPKGILGLTAEISGPLKNLTARADLKSDKLEFKKNIVNNVSLSLNFEPDFIELNGFSALYKGYKFKGNGITHKGTAKGFNDFVLNCAIFPKPSELKSYSVALKGRANPSKKLFSTDFTIKLPEKDNRITGNLSLDKETLNYTFGDEWITLNGSAEDIFKRPKINSSYRFNKTPILRYLGRDNDLFINGNGTIKGFPEELDVDGDLSINWSNNINSKLRGKAVISNISNDSRNFNFNGEMYDTRLRYSKPLLWSVSAKSDSGGIRVSAFDKTGISLSMRVSTVDASIAGILDMKEYPLESLIDMFRKDEFTEKGILTGKAVVSGKIDKPRFSTPDPVKAEKLFLAGIDRMNGTCRISGGFDELHFRDTVIYRNGIKAFSATGDWVEGTPFTLEARGEKTDLSCVSDIINDIRKTNGSADFGIKMVFTQQNGTIEGDFNVKNGHFLDVPFDSITGKMEGGSEGFRVLDILASREGLFKAHGEASSGYFWENKTEKTGLMLSATLEGNIMKAVPFLTTAVKEASGQGTINVSLGGTWQEPVILEGNVTVKKGMIKPSFLFDRLTNINGQAFIDPGFNTVSGLRAVRIKSLSASVEKKKLLVSNIQIGDEEWEKIKKPGLLNVTLDDLNLDFGVFTGHFDETKNRENDLILYIPGFMRENETGIFSVSKDPGDKIIVGAAENGENLSPFISGKIDVVSGDVWYPLLPVDEIGDNGGSEYLEDIFWDVSINSGPNVNYVNEKNFALGRFAGTTLWRNELKIDENSYFDVYGRISDGSFRVTGNARSTYGTVTYYGYNFDIEWTELQLDTANILKPAILTGRAKTITIDEETGVETEIYLNINFIDRESGRATEARGRATIPDDENRNLNRPQTRFDAGPLGILEIKFTSSNPSDDTQDKIWARLGISIENIGTAATRAFTTGIDNYYFNPLLRPFEERLKKILKIDMVRITPSFLGNFAQSRLGSSRVNDPSTNYIMFDRSRIMLGEFFMDDWFLSYIGQYGVGKDFLDRREKGFYHDLGLQYMIDRNLRLQFHYTYDQIIKQPDKHFELRYDFRFD